MKFRDTSPRTAWWHDIDLPPGSSLLDVDHVTNIMMARVPAGGDTPQKLGYSGHYMEGLDAKLFLSKFRALLDSHHLGLLCYVDDDYPDHVSVFFESGAAKLSLYDEKADVEFLSTDPELFGLVCGQIRKLLVKKPPQGTVYMMTATARGPEFHSVGVGGHGLERDNYEHAVLAAYDRIVGDLRAETPRGRLSILDGPPGCGKTYLIRGMLQDVADVVFVVVPPHFLPDLAAPQSLTAITKLREDHDDKPLVFVVEDADECLAPRDGGNMSAVSMVLNLGDGIIGSVLDIRIVATTNAKHGELDPAIKRPGRLTVCQTVGPLSAAKAVDVYRRLVRDEVYPGATINRPMTLAEVYQLAYDHGWQGVQKTERRVGFGN